MRKNAIIVIEGTRVEQEIDREIFRPLLCPAVVPARHRHPQLPHVVDVPTPPESFYLTMIRVACFEPDDPFFRSAKFEKIALRSDLADLRVKHLRFDRLAQLEFFFRASRPAPP